MIYFDHNATTSIFPEALQEMVDVYNMGFVNPSSIHSAGKKAKILYQKAKDDILSSLNAKEYDLVFTSSGTEANNLALHGKKVLITGIEHESINNQPLEKTIISVDSNGLVILDEFKKLVKSYGFTSIIWANNQTGIVQDMPSIIQNKGDCLLHTDAVQYAGKNLINLEETPVDALTISSHKIHGPHGIACLIFKKNFHIEKLIYGGSQEQSLRAGTYNLPAICGFALAVKKVNNVDYINQYHSKTAMISNKIIEFVCNNNGSVVGKKNTRLSNTMCIIKEGVLTTEQLLVMDVNKVCVSAGSACSAGVVSKSYVLQQMGLGDEEVSCAIRVSVDSSNTLEEVEKFCKVWKSL